MVDTVLVKNANRMMMVASLLEDGIELSFADGCKGLIPFERHPRDQGTYCGIQPLTAEPIRDGPRNYARRADRDSLGLCPSLLRRDVPSDGRGDCNAGKADTWQTHPPAKEVPRG